MKHSSVALIIGSALVLVVGAAVIFRTVNQPALKKKSVLTPQNHSVSYVVYNEKDTGRQVDIASSTVIIIQLPKIDFEPVSVQSAVNAPIGIKYEDVGENIIATFTVSGTENIHVTAKSKDQHKPDFILTIKPY